VAGRIRFSSIVGSYGQELLARGSVDIVHLDEPRSISYSGAGQFFLEAPEISDAFWAFQLKPRTLQVSPIYVAVLRDCLVMPNGVVLLKDGSVLLESIFPASMEEFERAAIANLTVDDYRAGHYAEKARGGPEVVEMDRAVHCRDRGESGYYHWLSAIIPRLGLVRHRTSFAGLPHLIEPQHGFGPDWLGVVAPDLPVHRSRQKSILVKELVFPAPAQVGSSHYARNPELLQHFRRMLREQGVLAQGTPPEKRRKLYVTRSDAPVRRVTNEDALMARLGGLGFERVSLTGMAVREQIQLFADAATVVAPHGAGLTNVLFCEAGTTVIELMSPTRVWPGFKVISRAVGANYAAYVSEAFETGQTERVGAGNEDFTVRPESCMRFVEACIS
jgi:capsular polysaccharide biosynthesis protein